MAAGTGTAAAAVSQPGGPDATVSNEPTVQPPDGKVLAYLKHLFETHAGKDGHWTSSQVKVFILSVQHHDPAALSPAAAALLALPSLDLDGFLDYMTSPDGGIIENVPAPEEDLSWPMASYFISSSHNTYLSGNQLSSKSTTEAYTNVLLRGCRCVEIDVWDGDDSDSSSSDDSSHDSDDDDGASSTKRSESAPGDKKIKKKKSSAWKTLEKLKNKLPASISGKQGDSAPDRSTSTTNLPSEGPSEERTRSVVEPRVLHGYTLTKEVLFRDVCAAIRESAFAVTDLPLIVSLEVHCSLDQQAVMVDIMKECWGSLLVPEPETPIDSLPSPGELRNKILIKVKYSPPEQALTRVESGASGTSNHSSSAEATKQPAKPSKIAPALGKLAVYLRGVSFKAWSQPEASSPSHIFSLSEKKFLGYHEDQWATLFAHNRDFLVRAYPSGLRIGSSNLNPGVFWGSGAQIVALNWQETDVGTMLNEGMFAGTGGFVLKPEGFRPNLPSKKTSPNTVVRRALSSLSFTFLAARNIPLPPDEKNPKSFNPYIKIELHTEASEKSHAETHPPSSALASASPDDNITDAHVRDGELKLHTETHNGRDVDLKAEQLVFKNVAGLIEGLTFVRFVVKDDELGKDKLAAWACVRLDRLGLGYRFIKLLDAKGGTTGGQVLVKVERTDVAESQGVN